MGIPMDFLRGFLGVLCIFFAHMAGRAAAAVRKGATKPSRLYSWIIRTVLCAGVLIFRSSLDLMALAVWGLAALAFGAGVWDAGRQRQQEDLTRQIFPE